MTAEVSVRPLGEPELPLWERLVATSPEGSIYSTPAYLDVLCRATGGTYELLGVWVGDELSGGIALYRERRWYGSCSGPRLLLYYHSPLVRHYETIYPSQLTGKRLKVLGALARYLVTHSLASATLKCRPTVTDVRAFTHAGWTCAPSYTYVVPIADLALQRKKVEQNLRRLMRRAEEEGVTVAEDDDGEVFYRLHLATMQRKGGAPYLPWRAFRSYLDGLRAQNLCRLYHARSADGTVIAGQLVLLGPGPVSHTVMASSDEAHLRSGASAFLRWRACELLAGLGYAANDLTDAALNPVTRFKSQLGGRLELCHVLSVPPSARVRLAQRADTLGWRTRWAVGTALRRVGLRRRRG